MEIQTNNKNKMMSMVRRVFVASNLSPNAAPSLRKALDDAGYGQISVEELSFNGRYGNVKFTEESLEKMHQIEYLFADPDIIAIVFKHPDSNLLCAQCTNAGVDTFFHEIKDIPKTPKFLMTRHFDGFGQQMAEYILGRIIFRERHFGDVHDLQKERKYATFGGPIYTFRTLDQLDLGIIGFGQLGKKVAQSCRAMGMTVWAAVRDERYSSQGENGFEHTDHVRPMSRLSEMLESCDYVVSILPSVSGTKDLLSGDALKPCQKKKSVFINVGRGNVIDDESLINAVRSGWLGGAILDVFNQEPLPPSSELWTLPNVSITPHYSASARSGKQRPADSLIYNLKKYLEGKPMKCVVDFSKGY